MLLIHPQYKIFCVKLNLRTKFTTHKLLGIIKKGLVFNIKILTSSFCAKPLGGVAESRIYLEIDSATAGEIADGQKDWLWILVRK